HGGALEPWRKQRAHGRPALAAAAGLHHCHDHPRPPLQEGPAHAREAGARLHLLPARKPRAVAAAARARVRGQLLRRYRARTRRAAFLPARRVQAEAPRPPQPVGARALAGEALSMPLPYWLRLLCLSLAAGAAVYAAAAAALAAAAPWARKRAEQAAPDLAANALFFLRVAPL